MNFIHARIKHKTDEELMSLIVNNDRSAFEELYGRYSKKMLSYFYRMFWGDYEKAKDFLQDLFLKIIESPESFDTRKVFTIWFFSLASNMCKNEYKKLKIRDEHIKIEENKSIIKNEDYYDTIDLKSFRTELYIHLESISYEHKTIFLLRYGNDLSIKEIAEVLDCPEGTVKSRLFYTVKYLSEKLTIYNPKVIEK